MIANRGDNTANFITTKMHNFVLKAAVAFEFHSIASEDQWLEKI